MASSSEPKGFRRGMRIGLPLALPTAALGVSFGAYATLAGWPPAASIIMSAVVLSGSAQFALVTSMSGGAGLVTGIGAAALMNLRFVPMAAASARSLHGGPVQRAFEGQTVFDGSWVPAQRPDGTTDRELMFGSAFVQWPAWIGGTALGALLVPSSEFLYTYGLDVIFPCFFLILLLQALRERRRHLWVALAAVAIAGAAILVVPPGVALLVSALATLVTLVPRRAGR